jgi:hypothetical protein
LSTEPQSYPHLGYYLDPECKAPLKAVDIHTRLSLMMGVDYDLCDVYVKNEMSYPLFVREKPDIEGVGMVGESRLILPKKHVRLMPGEVTRAVLKLKHPRMGNDESTVKLEVDPGILEVPDIHYASSNGIRLEGEMILNEQEKIDYEKQLAEAVG